MITEATRRLLINSLSEIDYNINSYNPGVYRAGQDLPKRQNGIIISFIPSSMKRGRSLSNFVGKRDNKLYSDYGYGEEEVCYIRVFARPSNGIYGMDICETWLHRIENYIRGNWNGLLTDNAFIKNSSFTPVTPVLGFNIEEQNLYELSLTIRSHHGWSNEPVDDPLSSDTTITSIEVNNELVWIND